MKKLFVGFLGMILILLIIIVLKTLAFKSLQITAQSATLPVLDKGITGNLSKALTFRTISYDANSPVDTMAFRGYHQFLAESYPLLHSTLKKETFSEFSLLYTWQGTNPAIKPIILTAHMDVVDAEDPGSWTKPPFSGENDGTYIWGRGTLDDKGEMISIFEAVEKLLKENYQPERTIYLAFGHDEELSGLKGAAVMASALKERSIEAEFLLDEGYAVTIGMVPMVSKPVALIGTSEKGYLSVGLSVEIPGGHSAFPKKESAITVMTNALNAITENQMKAKIIEPIDDFIRYVGPEMPFYARAVFANKWLFKGVILDIYQGSHTSNALVRTTTAPTVIHAGSKDNVIPLKAEAIVNFRILPGETSADVLDHLKNTISDERVRISVLEGLQEPKPVSPVNGFGFKAILNTIRQVYPEALVAPTMVLVASDSRKYSEVCENIYNFAPIIVTSEDLARTHGLDERTKIEDYLRGVVFYYQLIKNSNVE